MVRFTSCIIIFGILSPLIIADPCRFEDSTQGVIDISSVGHTDGTAAFPDLIPTSPSGYKYSYNPCKSFSEGGCTNVAACQVSLDGMLTFTIATQDTANLDLTPGINPTIVYTADIRTTRVELACSTDSTNKIEALGEGPPATYAFRLTSKCSCWNGCKGGSGGGGDGGSGGVITGGAVFIIILVTVVVIYLVVFAVFNGVRHQRRGVDLIAHRTFWVAVPVYAKDGFRYLFYRVTGKGGGAYQSV